MREPDDALHRVTALDVPWVAGAGADDHVLDGGVAEQLRAIGDMRVAPGAHATPIESPEHVANAMNDLRATVAHMA